MNRFVQSMDLSGSNCERPSESPEPEPPRENLHDVLEKSPTLPTSIQDRNKCCEVADDQNDATANVCRDQS